MSQAPRYRVGRQCAGLQAGGEGGRTQAGLGGTVLLLVVLAQHRYRRTADRPGEAGIGPQSVRPPVVAVQVGRLLPHPWRGYALQRVHESRQRDLGREVHQQVDVVGLAVELGQFAFEVGAHVAHDLLRPLWVPPGEHLIPVLHSEHQHEKIVTSSVYVTGFCDGTSYGRSVQLRYSYRLYPSPGQQVALARAFGCARVVFNDALAARQAAHEAGQPYVTDAELSARLTVAKKTPDRAWLNEVSSVVLQQALADLNSAYRNFFASVAGNRKGPKIAPPRFRSRRDRRQTVRFTANARFAVLGNGKLRLPKIGDVAVRWSRELPSVPSSVTVIKDAAGRYFASFVVEVGPQSLPETDRDCGIDLGLTHFAVLGDGTKIGSPRFLRRTEKKLRRAQKNLSRKQKGSANRAKARIKVARAHAAVADARLNFHHKLSTAIIRENQAVYVEDLAVKGLARTRLAKSVHDAGWSAFIAMLEYKAKLHGRQFAKIGRFEPTSQVCSACGVKDGPKPLAVRQWRCAACSTIHDRDINAAKNIAALGRREAQNACEGDVRPVLALAVAGEAGSRRGAA
jgi:putative transposase